MYYAGSDGSQQFRAWYDNELDLTCSFRTVSSTEDDSGVLARCMPWSYTLFTNQYFEDAACTKPVLIAYVEACEDLTRVRHVRTRTTTCGESPTIYQIESIARVEPTDELWSSFNGESCDTISENLRPSLVWIETGKTIDIEKLVAATEETGS